MSQRVKTRGTVKNAMLLTTARNAFKFVFTYSMRICSMTKRKMKLLVLRLMKQDACRLQDLEYSSLLKRSDFEFNNKKYF